MTDKVVEAVANTMTPEQIAQLAMFSCRNDSCREEVSYPQDMLRKDPETGEPVCEACWGEDRWVGHASEDYVPVDWGDLESYQPLDEAMAVARLEGAKAMQDMCADAEMRAHMWMVAHDKLLAGQPYDYPAPADLPTAIAAARLEGARAMQERCARVADDMSKTSLSDECNYRVEHVAAAIRALNVEENDDRQVARHDRPDHIKELEGS